MANEDDDDENDDDDDGGTNMEHHICYGGKLNGATIFRILTERNKSLRWDCCYAF